MEENVCKNGADEGDHVHCGVGFPAAPGSVCAEEANKHGKDAHIEHVKPSRLVAELLAVDDEQHGDEQGRHERRGVAE